MQQQQRTNLQPQIKTS